jgi:hypothetical protein
MAQQFKPAQPVKTTSSIKPTDARPAYFVFDKSNYRLLIISIAIVVLGFILMSGTTDIYGTTKIVIAPIVILGGFAVGFFAIFKKPASN